LEALNSEAFAITAGTIQLKAKPNPFPRRPLYAKGYRKTPLHIALTWLSSSCHSSHHLFETGTTDHSSFADLGPLKLRVGIVRLGSASPRAGCTIKHLVATPCTLLVNLASEKDQGASGSDATTASWLAPWSYPPPKLSTFHPQFLASSGRSNTRKASDGAPSSVLCRSYSTRPMRSGRSARP
jgi:hypothetical protein